MDDHREHEHCGHALFLHEDIAQKVAGWPIPKALWNWLTLTRDPHHADRGVPDQGAETGSPPTGGVGTDSPDTLFSRD